MSKKTFDAGRFDAFRFKPEDLTIIGIDTDDGPEHPLWDERIHLPLDESMVLSFMAIGVKVAITVRKRPGGGAEVVDGRRRTLHAREANKRLAAQGEPLVTVPAVQERGSDEHQSHVMVATNEIRHEDELLVKAAKAKRMLDRCGEINAVALAFGVTTRTIQSWVRIDELPKEIKKAVSDGVMSTHAAAQLHDLSPEEQTAKVAEARQTKQATGKPATARDTTTKSSAPSKKEIRARLEGKLHPEYKLALEWVLGQ